MITNRINDFRSQPAWYEYCVFYTCTAIPIYILGLACLNKVTGVEGWIAFILLASVIYIFTVIKRTRDIAAYQHYLDFLNQFSLLELHNLLPRMNKHSQEYKLMLRRIKYLQGQHNTVVYHPSHPSISARTM